MSLSASLGCLLLGLALLTGSAVAEDSRYQRTLLALQGSEAELKGRFAVAALLELNEVYLAEADLARKESESAEAPAKLYAWSRAVEQFASQLALVMDDIDFGLPVELQLNPREVAAVRVAGRTIMLAHPRHTQQLVYEQSVLNLFCAGNPCRELTSVAGKQSAIPMSAALVVAGWEFSEHGPICSHLQLQVSFKAAGNLRLQRQLCQQLMQEVEILATELAWQQRHDIDIDWDGLNIKSTPRRPEHLVLLNGVGDSLLVSLPLLYGTDQLLEQVSPWLQQRHSRDGPPAISLDASALGWE
ncbi:MAG: hypothetical protein V7720_11830 [Halioglobus sp.]